jgi:hypothetical protein
MRLACRSELVSKEGVISFSRVASIRKYRLNSIKMTVFASPLFSIPTKKAATIINAITTQSLTMYAIRLSSIRVREVHGELT